MIVYNYYFDSCCCVIVACMIEEVIYETDKKDPDSKFCLPAIGDDLPS